MAGQLAFPFAHRVSLARRDFIVADCNRAAVSLLDSWPRWPHHAALLHGPKGSGKTHLATAWAVRAGARIVDGASLTRDSLALALAQPPDGQRSGPGLEPVREAVSPCAIVVERAELATERPLLHLHNLLLENGGYLLITARSSPQQWRLRLPDLASRLNAALQMELGQPDDQLLAGVLLKLLGDRQLSVSEALVSYLVNRMERSLAAAEQMIEELDRRSLAEGRPITPGLVKDVLTREASSSDEQLLFAF